MRRGAVVTGVIVAFILTIISPDRVYASSSRTTVLIYMNAKSRDLDCFALQDIREMTRASLHDINVIVELGRLRHPGDCPCLEDTQNRWTGTLFFKIRPNLVPTPESAISDAPEPLRGVHPPHVDMGSPGALHRFVKWAKRQFPAEHYILIIWGHGRGFLAEQLKATDFPTSEQFTGFERFSYDPDNNTELSTHDLRIALQRTGTFDVVGFDSCLMGTIETAYALRGLAKVMVASQQLEPLVGWDYTDVLSRLGALRKVTPTIFGIEIVESFRHTFGDTHETSLSAINVRYAERLAHHISHLAEMLRERLSRRNDSDYVEGKMLTARSRSESYGQAGGFNSLVDLSHVMVQLADQHFDGALQHAVEQIFQESLSNQIIVDNYASKSLKNNFGSYGLSIFFAKDRNDYMKPDAAAYQLATCQHPENSPVDFVCDLKWSVLIAEFVGARD